jgi:hypothetical protein
MPPRPEDRQHDRFRPDRIRESRPQAAPPVVEPPNADPSPDEPADDTMAFMGAPPGKYHPVPHGW